MSPSHMFLFAHLNRVNATYILVTYYTFQIHIVLHFLEINRSSA